MDLGDRIEVMEAVHTLHFGAWRENYYWSYTSRRRHTRYWRDWSSDVCSFDSSRRRHTRYWRDWSSDVCSSDLIGHHGFGAFVGFGRIEHHQIVEDRHERRIDRDRCLLEDRGGGRIVADRKSVV